MKIDPDNYDLRELRRIADERRSDRDGTNDREPRRGYDEDRGRRGDEGRRSRDGSGRDGRDSRDRHDGRDGDGDYDRRDRRSRSRRDDGLRRPREGYSDHADAHDEVVRADRIANHFGLGERRRGGDGRRRDGRDDGRDGRRGGFDELGYDRSRDDRAYDFDEVGEFRFDKPVRDRPRGRAGEALRHNQLEQLLVHETAAAGGSLEKPYLSTIPKEYAAERVVFDWLEFLVLKGGFKRTMDALRYYLSVDWITEDVETELHDYLIGFSGNVSNTTEFDVDDHHLSLVYVAQLASMAGGEPTESPPPQLR